MISAVVSNRSPQTASRSARVRLTVVRPCGVRTTTAREVRALRSRLAASTSSTSSPRRRCPRDLVQFVGREHVAEPCKHEVEQALVDVGAAQRVMPVSGQDLDRAAGDPQHGGVERAAAEVVDQHGAVPGGGQTVVGGGRHRFVEQFEHVEPGDAAPA